MMMVRSSVSFAVLGILVLYSLSGISHSFNVSKISVRGKWLVDKSGRVRLFHGINAVTKRSPQYPTELLNDTYLDNLQKWGFNVIRLGAIWGAAEPSSYVYNTTYIGMLRTIVKKLHDRGIYAFMDMHQDGLSSKFQQYDGIPRFILDDMPPPRKPYPWPFENKSEANFPEVYLTEACGEAFQNIYDNVANSLTHMERFWQKVAGAVGDIPTVLGYDLINEPWFGDIFKNHSLLLPENAGRYNLMPMYDKLNTAIRKVDTETILFYEPVTVGVYNNKGWLDTGFDHVPGGDNFRNRSVLSYHWYCPLLTSVNESAQFVFWKQDVCDKLLEPVVFESVLDQVDKIGGSSFLSEFGICSPNKNINSTGNVECSSNLKAANKYLQSWTYWDRTVFYNADGQPNMLTVTAFSQPYAQAIAGVPTAMNFDPDSSLFTLTYDCNPVVMEPTAIYVPIHHYPTGFNVSLSGHADATVVQSAGSDTVHVTCTTQSEVVVTIAKK